MKKKALPQFVELFFDNQKVTCPQRGQSHSKYSLNWGAHPVVGTSLLVGGRLTASAGGTVCFMLARGRPVPPPPAPQRPIGCLVTMETTDLSLSFNQSGAELLTVCIVSLIISLIKARRAVCCPVLLLRTIILWDLYIIWRKKFIFLELIRGSQARLVKGQVFHLIRC